MVGAEGTGPGARGSLRAALVAAGLAALLVAVGAPAARTQRPPARCGTGSRSGTLAASTAVRTWRIRYRSHARHARWAYVVLPAWYGPRRHPSMPLVISPHGRGLDGRTNARVWGRLPAVGCFAVVNPDGDGNRLGAYSWGAPGQIADLARMPAIVERTLPWLRIDPRRVYAVGGSMGGQETLLLVARHPGLLAGAIAFDPVFDFVHQYYRFPRLPCNARCHRVWRGPRGKQLQVLARREVGGSPRRYPGRFARRSPVHWVREIVRSKVPLQLWWSTHDRIVVDAPLEARRFLDRALAISPHAPLLAVQGAWQHSIEMTSAAQLPTALEILGLLPAWTNPLPRALLYWPRD